MTRKDFQLIADAINELRPDLPTDDITDHGLDVVAGNLADALRTTSPRFDRARFLRACGCDVQALHGTTVLDKNGCAA